MKISFDTIFIVRKTLKFGSKLIILETYDIEKNNESNNYNLKSN